MIYRDALGLPEASATISHFGGSYGRGGYWAICSTIVPNPYEGLRFATPSEAESALLAAGWTVLDRDKDGYGCARITARHTETAGELQRLINRDADQWASAVPCYVRYGRLPATGHSTNHADGTAEAGVSVFAGQILPDGRARALPNSSAEAWSMLSLRANRALYVVAGDYVGTGSDGEPVLAACRIIRKARQG